MTDNLWPANAVSSDRLLQQLAFIMEIDRLKHVLRRSRLVGGARRENSAEHSWHIAVAALVLSEYANEPVDAQRVVKMLLVHDIVEIDAGDTFAYDVASNQTKDGRERAAAGRIFGLLPEDQGAELYGLWEEFEAQATPDARFANAVDRLLPTLHNYLNDGGTWRALGVDATAVDRRLAPIGEGSTQLGDFVQALVKDAIRRGVIRAAVTKP